MLPFRPVRVLAVALLAALTAALLTVLFPASTAHAASRTVRGGRLDWGIKSSFQSYVTGPIAKGSWGLRGGAATVGGSRFRFHSAAGSYDPDSGAFTAAFSGGVHFTGHRKPDGTQELDLTISRPTVRISAGHGTLYADMVSRSRATGRFTTSAQVPLATLALSGVDMKGGGSPIALNSLPATLTSQGATAFAGYYTAGTALDPVSLSADVLTPAAHPGGPSGKPSGTPTAGKPTGKAAKDSAAGAIRDAAVDWGVRRTYREYVTGAVARGKWTLSDGAQDGGALFRFAGGRGTYDEKKQTLDAHFTGTVRFTGTRLDVRLAGLAVKVEGGRGTLSAAGTPVVTFKAGRLTADHGLIALDEAPTELTAGGAKLLGSMYRPGTAMDPVSLAVAIDDKAALPALPDLGSTASATPAPAPNAGHRAAAGTDTAARSADGRTGTYAGLGAGVLVAAALVFLAVRRRRGARQR
ncbi:Htaa domain protein [Streptomyces sp. SID10853]|uniref:HtaA domain-containing protein n=1 Tax=Streptomyces sp. SID10853 TaxID=2706028 RepID=UPI0013C12183|nr:HtaA domain-containing protein [Streptomyces sp. SID10853]NDZ83616.1 Htaa domain protein [Streptomyces sp. SID10853]